MNTPVVGIEADLETGLETGLERDEEATATHPLAEAPKPTAQPGAWFCR